jgi:hypothetical protein
MMPRIGVGDHPAHRHGNELVAAMGRLRRTISTTFFSAAANAAV